MDIDTELKIWAAGAFDGEGTIAMSIYKSGGSQLLVGIGNTDFRMIKPFLLTWGGTLSTQTKGYKGRKENGNGLSKRSFWLHFRRKEAKKLLQDILPYLRVRGELAQFALRVIEAEERAIMENKAIGRVTSEFHSEYLTLRQELHNIL